MSGFWAGRRRVRAGVVGVVVGCALGLGGCASAGTDAKAAVSAAAAPVVPMVIGKGQAEDVYNRWVAERKSSLDRRDGAGLASVETGPLLAESLAAIEVAKARGVGARNSAFGRAEFFVPAERDQQGYPRSFVALSRVAGTEGNAVREGALHYFTQEAPGGDWKAAAVSWVNDRPPLVRAKNETSWGTTYFELRKKEIAAVNRDAAGAAVLSPAAGADREVCGRYAEYMSFTAPEGEPESEHFLPGPLTGGMVGAYNVADEDLKLVTKRYAFEPTGGELPVLRLADGKSLVTCTFVRTDRWAGKKAAFRYGNGEHGDAAALLGGTDKWWVDSTVRLSVTATFEVPAEGPADVVGCNCLKPTVLSALGTPK
ncbi:hypothetical protein MTF65_18140 [Streptomyces sp. APSN-46.1]|uniref:hypothetical protein n=1 Tax=Streptomyces sp. APSN-46.1 TaxID=2929049 RepID=UPI001FB56A37|nr:hypothetical protein [Streptomyces sp. APSN-46.1]MCJ1679228.1 hypothetical protein [Streptomyces sp. APSN-46.1]